MWSDCREFQTVSECHVVNSSIANLSYILRGLKTPEALKTLSDAHCSNVTTGIMSTILLFEEGASEGRVRGGEGHKGGRSGSEWIIGAPEGMGGPQRV